MIQIPDSNPANSDQPKEQRTNPSVDFDFARLDFGPSHSPDLTRRIMGRLGYMPVSAKIAKRHRNRRWANRLGLLAAAALAFGVAFEVYEHGSDVRRANDLTIPRAIGTDFQNHQDRIGNVIHTIRNLVPVSQPQHDQSTDSPQEEPADGNIDQSMYAPWGWV